MTDFTSVAPVLPTRDVRGALALYERLGFDFHAPKDTDYGLREGAYVDPDGNLIRSGSPMV